MKYLSLAVAALFVVSNTAIAQDTAPEDPNEWTIETYPFPATPLVNGFATTERGELHSPALPDMEASDEEIADFVRKSNSIVGHWLENEGLSLPKGAIILFDPESLTLAARLPRIAQSSIAFTSEALQGQIPSYIELNPKIIEGPAPLLRGAVETLSREADHSAVVADLEKQISLGNGAVLFRSRIDARSGMRSRVSLGEEIVSPNELVLSPAGVVEYLSESTRGGTTFEVDPVLSSDEEFIDLNFSLRHRYAPDVRTQKTITRDDETTFSAAVTDTFDFTLQNTITMQADTGKVLGVWKPEGLVGKEDTLQAALLTADVVRVLPLTNPILADYLEKYGETILPTPEGPPVYEKEADEIPDGMMVRRYQVPPTFFTSNPSGGGGGADPFAAPISSEPRFAIKATVKDILESSGITFPTGSSANYLRSTGTLVVRNTPEQIQLVEAYIMSIKSGVDHMISFTLHIVEAPADLIRESSEKTRGLANHIEEWERLQSEEAFTILTTNWTEARSGQRTKIEAGRTFSYPASAESTPAGSPTDDESEATPSYLSGFFEQRLVGTAFTIDPVLSADEQTIDLNFSVRYDFAPPSIDGEAGFADGAVDLEGPSTTFHYTDLATQATFRSGMIRMVGVWKPTGTPELDEADRLQAVFLRADIVPLIPEEAE